MSAERAADVTVVAKGGAVQLVGQIAHRSLAFFFNVIVARVLGPAGFGLYQVVVQLLSFLGQLGLLGFNYAATRFITRARALGDHGAVRGTFRIAMGASMLVSAVLVLSVLLGADALGDAFSTTPAQDDRFATLLRIGVLFIPFFAAMQVLRFATQAYMTMVPSVLVGNLIQPSGRFVIGAALLAGGMGVSGAIAGDVISMGIAVVAGAFFYRRILTEEELRATPHAEVGPIVRFALPQSGTTLLGLQSLGLGVILLGLLSTNEQAGLFAIALALQGPANVSLSGMINIWAPVVSDLYDQGEIHRLDSLYKTITRWIATAALPISAAMIIEAELFAKMFGGNSASDAAPIVAILALGNVVYTCAGPAGTVLSMAGRPGLNFLDSLGAVALYALLGWMVIPEHGAVGLAWVETGVIAFVHILRVVQVKVLIGVQPIGRSLLKPVVGTLAGCAALLVWKLVTPDGIGFEIAGLVLGTIVYLIALKAAGLDEEELFVWQAIKARSFGLKRRDASDDS